MPASPTISFTKNGPSLFTPEEVRHLMNVEFDRAKRHTYPVTCMMILVDRLDQIQTIHGYESKENVLQAIVELLKRETRASDFLGCLVDDRILALFPHTSVESSRFLAQRILDGTRTLEFGLPGQTMRVTASVGLSHNLDGGAQSFEVLLRVAEEGLTVADAGGGDRFVETELYELYEEQRLQRLSKEPEIARVPHVELPPPRPRLVRDEEPQVVPQEPSPEELEAAAAELSEERVSAAVRVAREEQEAELASKEAEHQRELDILHRRLRKLTEALDTTESELVRVREAKVPDEGMPSVYAEVQGLDPEADYRQMKYELICSIFEANLELQRKSA